MIQVQTLADALAVTKAGTVYSNPLLCTFHKGFIGLRITTTAGSVTITQQCSEDGVTYYDPVDQDGTALGAVVAAMTAGGKYIQYSPVISKFMRFKIVEGNVAALSATIKAIVAEEN